MDDPHPPAAFSELPYYAAHFMDQELWEPFVRRVALQHGFTCRRVQPGLPGTYPTFIVETGVNDDQSISSPIVVKFFGPLFQGEASYQVERAMGHFIAQHPFSIRSPAILAEGKLSAEWSYLVFEHVGGASLGEVRHSLSDEAFTTLAGEMGGFMKDVHTHTATSRPIIPIAGAVMCWDEYLDFLAKQHDRCQLNHRRWKDLPDHLLDQVGDFLPAPEQLLDQNSASHLIHADLTADHLLGQLTPIEPVSVAATTQAMAEWQSLAIIDWGDCRVGNILYELVALHLDMFHADKRLLRICLQAYGLPIFYQQDFARKALSMVLLHEFPLPAPFQAQARAASSLEELAEDWFGIW